MAADFILSLSLFSPVIRLLRRQILKESKSIVLKVTVLKVAHNNTTKWKLYLTLIIWLIVRTELIASEHSEHNVQEYGHSISSVGKHRPLLIKVSFSTDPIHSHVCSALKSWHWIEHPAAFYLVYPKTIWFTPVSVFWSQFRVKQW